MQKTTGGSPRPLSAYSCMQVHMHTPKACTTYIYMNKRKKWLHAPYTTPSVTKTSRARENLYRKVEPRSSEVQGHPRLHGSRLTQATWGLVWKKNYSLNLWNPILWPISCLHGFQYTSNEMNFVNWILKYMLFSDLFYILGLPQPAL